MEVDIAVNEQTNQLELRMVTAEQYFAQLPMFVEVTLANDNEGTEYYHLTPCDPWSPPFPFEVTLRSEQQEIVLPGKSVAGPVARGFTLASRQARTFVVDLSEVDVDVPPGAWAYEACWIMRHEAPRAAATARVVRSMGPEDAALVASLRRIGDPAHPKWRNFIEDPAAHRHPALERLSAEACEAIAPYLLLQRMVTGPLPLAAFPLGGLEAHDRGPWASESAALRYELLWARKATTLAAERSRLLGRWPGVEFRVVEIERGLGVLTRLREAREEARKTP